MDIRPWRDGDQAAVDALLDTEPDPLWAVQGHRLHGAERDGDRWRRTWLAERDGAVVGAATLGRNWVHPDRYSLAVEVAPHARRQGLAAALIDHARAQRPEPLPMSAKVRERDPAATALATRLGAVTYLRSLCPAVDVLDPRVLAWCAAHRPDRAEPLAVVARAEWPGLFADQYRWVHAERSPVGSETALQQMSRLTVAEADPELSSVLRSGGRVVAAAFVFPAGDAVYECVTETQTTAEPDGVALLGDLIARSISALGRGPGAGRATIEFDGHDSDPHLAPLVASLPVRSIDPLRLVTIDAPRGAHDTLQ